MGVDLKYGRLFTEDDVVSLISTTMGIIGLGLRNQETVPVTGREMLLQVLAVTEPTHLRFPADEPLFLLRGQDKASSATLDAYWDAAVEAHRPRRLPTQYAIGIRRARDAFDNFASENPQRMRAAD